MFSVVASLMVDGKRLSLRKDDREVAVIKTSILACCGLNSLELVRFWNIETKPLTDKFIDWMVTHPWEKIESKPRYKIDHLIFSCGMGYHDYLKQDRSCGYKHLITHPRMKQLHRYPSHSEPAPDHDIGLFFLDLS